MRPRRNAGEYLEGVSAETKKEAGFNEAPAQCRGIRTLRKSLIPLAGNGRLRALRVFGRFRAMGWVQWRLDSPLTS
jgi:hypothetical protein